MYSKNIGLYQMSTDINTLNLADNGDGMVSLNDNPTTNFVNKILRCLHPTVKRFRIPKKIWDKVKR